MRTKIGCVLVVVALAVIGLLQKEAVAQSRAQSLASGTVGIVQFQTLRLSITNIGPSDVNVRASLISNPTPVVLGDVTFTLGPGESRDIDLPATDVTSEHSDRFGRTQIRAALRSSASTVLANLEVFDNDSGKTSALVSLAPFGPQ